MSTTYRSARTHHFGPPENISIDEVPVPSTNPGAVRVAVRTGGLNPIDARRRSGAFGGDLPMLLGTEFAGVVVDPGTDTEFRVGDPVIGFGTPGTDADLVDAHASHLAHKPAELDWDLAGGLSGVGQTAVTILDDLGLQPGQTLLVHGASGGVGTVLVQLAVAAGLHVIGTASEANQEHVRSLGAEPVLYGPGLLDALGDLTRIDGAADLAGSAQAGEIAESLLARGAKAITVVPETIEAHGGRMTRVRASRAGLERLIDAVLAGDLRVPVEAIPFTDIAEAHRRLDAKHATGKLVLDLSDNPWLPEGH